MKISGSCIFISKIIFFSTTWFVLCALSSSYSAFHCSLHHKPIILPLSFFIFISGFWSENLTLFSSDLYENLQMCQGTITSRASKARCVCCNCLESPWSCSLCEVPCRTLRDWVSREGSPAKKLAWNAVLLADADKLFHQKTVRFQQTDFGNHIRRFAVQVRKDHNVQDPWKGRMSEKDSFVLWQGTQT